MSATTAQSSQEATPSACRPGTTTTPSRASARGLTTPQTATPPRADARGVAATRTTTASSMIASGTLVSHIHFDLSLSTSAHPHTYTSPPIVVEA
jgi:hypothetical protein